MNLEGDCKLRVYIDEKGKPFKTEIVACPKPFEQAAIDAANASSFYPMKVEGKATKASFVYNYKFKLSS
jgi:TonB family protein